MIEALGLALLVVSGVDLRRVIVLGAAIHLPLVALALAGLASWKLKNDRTGRSALFCEGVASELRSGVTLRQALAESAQSVGVDLSPSWRWELTTDQLAGRLAEDFPDIASELAPVVRAAVRSGARSSDLFDEMGSLAIAKEEIGREVRVSTAPARATASVFLVAPVAYLLWQASGSGIYQLVSSSEQRVVAAVGLALFLAGLALAGRIMWKSR